MLLALQLSLQLDDVLKVLEAVPDSGKEKKKTKHTIKYDRVLVFHNFLSLKIPVIYHVI